MSSGGSGVRGLPPGNVGGCSTCRLGWALTRWDIIVVIAGVKHGFVRYGDVGAATEGLLWTAADLA